jgi:hypothetical protein
MHKFFRFLIKWFQYAPILWRDYDWDYAYILRLLQYKLRRTREQLWKYDYLLNTRRQCKEIRLAELLIDRILKDEYVDFEPWHNGAEADEALFRRLIAHDAYLKDQDWQYLGKHLAKYMRYWWD